MTPVYFLNGMHNIHIKINSSRGNYVRMKFKVWGSIRKEELQNIKK